MLSQQHSPSASFRRSPRRPGATTTPNPSFSSRIFSDVAGDITILVNGKSFLLHKFPLVSQSGKIRKMVAEANNKNPSELELNHIPGGPEAFQLAAMFCYGMNFEITASNVAHLRCAAEYLEMADEYREESLVSRAEAYLDEVVGHSLEKSVEVLSACEALLPIADELRIPERCIDSIAKIVCQEQLVMGLSRLDCDDGGGGGGGSLEWWVEDLSILGIGFYHRLILAMGKAGVRTYTIVASLMHYAQVFLKGIGKPQIWNPARAHPRVVEHKQKLIVEKLVTLLPSDKGPTSYVPLNFLFAMLRMGIVVDASLACRLELERRIACRLEMVLLDDLLIPSTQTGDSLFDVDMVHRILVHFLQRVEDEDNVDFGYESEALGSPSHGSILKVGRLVDMYLAEIAPDPYLSLDKFIAMIAVLPDYARVLDDGLYRAIDIYLKAHPMLSEQDCKRLCGFIECQKLSQEARNHASQNDRLPVQVVVKVLYFEQVRLKNTMSGDSGDERYLSQKMSSGVTSAAVSPRDTYASLRRENKELKMEISRMRVRLSDLEKEQVYMKQGMVVKSGGHGRTLLTSISKGIGKIGIFGGPAGGKHGTSGRTADGKTGRSKRFSEA
ncbi:unnamed protein product [Cuscuta campestris]|uniref:NPH3 domain-containing protein n=1 Tax=Cuscuta campestris TaxID=132261 RepID=A0A484L464_9ASTE|nr:unnamed protein product [Cuscuta campestris]